MAGRLPLWRRRIPSYPLYWEGNPQNRVFLCQFWMKLVKPKRPCPSDSVHFIVHPQMSKFDIKQYLEKIYKVPVLSVQTGIREGQYITDPISGKGRAAKEDDQKFAYVKLDKGETFDFPEILKEDTKLDKQLQLFKEKKREEIKEQHHNWDRMALPPWFR